MAFFFIRKIKRLRDVIWGVVLFIVVAVICIDVMGTLKGYKHDSRQNEHHKTQHKQQQQQQQRKQKDDMPSTTATKRPKHRGNIGACKQQERQDRLDAYCEHQRKIGAPICNPWTLHSNLTARFILVDDINKVLYCEVPKAACSSWKSLFLILTGKVNPADLERDYLLAHQTSLYKKVGLRYLDAYAPNERIYRVENYFKFLVTRHPYERLTSAYKDKILDTEWYHMYLGKWIMRHYRKNPDQYALDTGHNVTFKEFIQFISNPNELKVHQVHDGHWMSTASLCCPCMYKYDYIAKVETLQQDADYLLKKIVPGRSNLTIPHSHVIQGNKSESIVKQRLSELNEQERKGMDGLFSEDLAMFDYSSDEKNKPLCGEDGGCC